MTLEHGLPLVVIMMKVPLMIWTVSTLLVGVSVETSLEELRLACVKNFLPSDSRYGVGKRFALIPIPTPIGLHRPLARVRVCVFA